MMHASMWWRRVVARWSRNRFEDEMEEEIRDHLARRRAQLIEAGADPAAAGIEARRAFGSVRRVREELHDGWGFPRFESLLEDARYGARILRRAPGFTAVAVLSLSLGIGAAAAVFSVADAVLFRPLNVADPSALRSFQASAGFGGGARKVVFGADPAEIEAMRRSADFADLFAFRTVDDVMLAAARGGARIVRAELVSPGYFSALGVPSRSGRLLHPGDRGASPVPIVISERLWRGAFAADPAIVGRTATINRAPAVIVGVAGGFRGLMVERPADVFAPLDRTAVIEPTAAGILARLVMRLKPGITTSVAEQQMAEVYRSLGPPMARGPNLQLMLPDARRGVSDAREELRWPIGLGLVLVGVLLVVACANTAGLLAARFAARRAEFAVRVAIGAGAGRLIRQLVVEALLLALLAGLAALAIAQATGPLLGTSVPFGSTPAAFDVRFDWRLVAFTALASLVAALGAALMSMRQSIRTHPSAVLSENRRTVAHGRRAGTNILIASQVGCSLILLIVTAAMGRTLINLRHVDPGFDASDTIAVTANASARNITPAAMPTFFAGVYDRIIATPQVRQATFSQMGLLTRGMTTGTVDVPGFTPAGDEDRWVRLFFVGPHFFETAGMRIIAGDGLGPREMDARQRVAVVSERFAQFYFGGPQQAIGRLVNRDVRIVGVVADARYNTYRDMPTRAMFVPFTQAPPRATMTFIVRPERDARQAMVAIAEALREHDPLLKVTATPMASLVDATMGRERFAAWVAAGLSLLALILACAGVSAAVAFAVSERRRELAVRFALGATAADVARLVIRGPMRMAVAGMALGLPAAYALMRGASALLFGVSAFDLPIVLLCAAGLITVAALAAALPAWRVASIDPHECLKAG